MAQAHFFQCSVMTYMGKASLKKKDIYIYMHITDSLCYTAETKTTLQNNYTPIKIN